MIIDNKKTVAGVHIRRRLFLLLLAVAIVLLIFKDSLLGIDRIVYIVVLNILYITYYLWGSVKDYNYLYYNDMGSKLIFKYYFLEPLRKAKRTIEIDKNDFYKFRFQKKFIGLRLYLILYQKGQGGIAKYPPISMGLLKKKEIESIKNSLFIFSKEKLNE